MNKPPRTIVTLVALAACGAIGTGMALAIQKRPAHPSRSGKSTKPPEIGSPEVDVALEQTRQLVQALRANDWKPNRAVRELWSLSNQAGAGSSPDRANSSFAIPKGDYPYADIAVFSRTYVRQNVRHSAGDQVAVSPSGFYIVGWRDGRVEAVPAEKVREVSIGPGGRFALLFPGVTERPTP